MAVEWQIAAGSRTAHLIDTSRAAPRRSGPQSLCGRRPQRSEREWFSLPADEPRAEQVIRSYNCALCPDCRDAGGVS